MSLKLDTARDIRQQLVEHALWKPETPLKLALLGRGGNMPGYINIASESCPEGASIQLSADIQRLQFPQLSVSEIIVLDDFCRMDPASAIAFLSTCIPWLGIATRFTISVRAGNWTYPSSEESHSWSAEALIAVLDHFGLLIDYVNAKPIDGKNKITLSAGRPERHSSMGSRYGIIQRLIEGPICSLGCVPQQYTHEFYTLCLKFLNKETSSDSTPNFSLRVPTVKADRLQILHTVEFYPPHIGGAELVVKSISERLAERGHSVTVATTHLPERNFKELDGVHIEQFKVSGSSAIGIFGSEAAHYMRFLREFPCDVMMNYAAQQWATDLALPLLPRLKHRVNIIAPCGYSAMSSPGKLRLNEFLNYYQHVVPRALSDADAAIYHSALYQDYAVAEMLQLKNSEIIPNAVEEKEFERAPEVDFRQKYGIHEQYLLLCVANFVEGKDQEVLVELLREINNPNIALVLVGRDGPTLQRVREKAQGLKVHFLIDIPREDTVSAYFNSTLFVFASQLEASPLVILEAKAAKLPFVSTDVGNVREWKGGVVCDIESMKNEVQSLLDDATRRERLAHEGWQEYQLKHTWTKVVDKYEELYLRLHHAKKAGKNSLGRLSGGPTSTSASG